MHSSLISLPRGRITKREALYEKRRGVDILDTLKPPPVVSIYDDEFEGAFLNISKWNPTNNGATWAYNPSYAPSCLAIRFTTSSQDVSFRQQYGSPNTTPFSISVGGSITLKDDSASIYVYTGNATITDYVRIGIEMNGGFPKVSTDKWVSSSYSNLTREIVVPGRFIFRIERDVSNNWKFYYSPDYGYSWELMNTIATFSIDVAWFQFTAASSNQQNGMVFPIDFARINWLGVAL